MEAFAMFAAVMGKSAPAVSTSAVSQPGTSGVSTPKPVAAAEPTTAVPEEAVTGATLVVKEFTEGETPVLEELVEGENPVVGCDVPTGGEALTSERQSAGKTPGVVEGTEAQFVTGSPGGVETPVYIEGATPLIGKEDDLASGEAQEPVDDGMTLMVDLTDVPDGTDSPVNAREARRKARRSLRDEIDETVQQTEEDMLGRGAAAPEQADSPRPDDGENDEEERRRTVERKRTGKQIAPSSTKKARGKSADHSPSPPAKISSDAESESPNESSDSEEDQGVELNFEPKEIWITKELLNAMGKFDDPKRTAIYAEKSTVGKHAKSGKKYDSAELKGISSNDEFRGYIEAIGFDWLLKHNTLEGVDSTDGSANAYGR
ncbi:uncharacterized protein LOC121786709 [Salvia splendens]|uniref:uncharacterized protein LOC121786709 n=1 Tax=Salvia splendens TaxID=180675 RepID=UPI001C25F413|nr:uncharacterized protein LOC121786709 [Salvia splendens]